jgi:hypothetical protein
MQMNSTIFAMQTFKVIREEFLFYPETLLLFWFSVGTKRNIGISITDMKMNGD